jgi:glycosyltransferase involved in cell wall biosynthesis
LLKTKEALEKKGISVKLFNQWEDKLKDFDVLHIFGSVKDCLGLMQTAKAIGVRIVLSPIFWSTLQRSLHEYGGLSKKTQLALRHITKALCPFMPSERKKMFILADKIVPNSKAELDQIARLFYISRKKMDIVPLGADERFAKADSGEFISRYGVKDFILSVGRIEPRKNQLNLIKALKGSAKRLVFIGDAVSDYKDYYQECRRAADKDTLFINRIDHNDPMLASAYAACGVFVLQGWFETPGLVALEAGLAGAKLAVTKRGSTYEYFKGYAEYFNPASMSSINNAVERALEKQKTDELKNHIMANFLWSNAAEENIRVYKDVLR